MELSYPNYNDRTSDHSYTMSSYFTTQQLQTCVIIMKVIMYMILTYTVYKLLVQPRDAPYIAVCQAMQKEEQLQ